MHKFAEEESVSEIADAIFESYRLVGRINSTDGSLLPSKGVIGAICESFLELLFPGVYGNEPIYSPHLRNVTAHRLRGIATKLVIELWKISKLAPHFASAIEVEQALPRCLKKLPQVRELLESDIEAAYKSIE
jgi:serine O-acetyltransferase